MFEVSEHGHYIQDSAIQKTVVGLYDLNSSFCSKFPRPGEFSPLEKVDLSAINRQHDFNYKVTHNNEFVYIPQSCTMGCLGEH